MNQSLKTAIAEVLELAEKAKEDGVALRNLQHESEVMASIVLTLDEKLKVAKEALEEVLSYNDGTTMRRIVRPALILINNDGIL